MKTYSFGQAAKILRVYRKDKPDRLFGRNTLIRKLRENEILMMEENVPYQTFIQSNDFIVRKKVIKHSDGREENKFFSMFTEKGFGRLRSTFVKWDYKFKDD